MLPFDTTGRYPNPDILPEYGPTDALVQVPDDTLR